MCMECLVVGWVMKRVANIYNKICDINNIMEFEHIVSVNTKNKKKVERFEEYYVQNIYKLREKLITKSYIPAEYNIFFIHEPKLRLIMSQSIEDKIVNHMVAKYFLLDVFDNSFINTTVATRKGMGTHYGLKTVKKYINDMKRNNKNFYYLKFDIQKYFYNIDHNIIKEIINNKIKDKSALKLINIIIDSTNKDYINKRIIKLKCSEINKINNLNISIKEKKKRINEVNKIPLCVKGKSVPIGSMCSQIIAIIYLDKLNHFIKEKLHINKYILYMDDGILLHSNKSYLNYCKLEIEKYLRKLKLKINEKKTRVDSIKNGIDFLGFRFILKNNKLIVKVRTSTKKKFKMRMKKLNKLYLNKTIRYKELMQVKASYLGHLSYGDCSNLINLKKCVK